MFKRSLIMCGLVLLVLAGCTQARQESIEKKLELKIKLTMLEPGKVSISAGMHNPGKRDYPGNDENKGLITIKDEAGNLINDVKVYGFSALAAGESLFPFTYEMNFEPGVYTAQFSALDKPPVQMQFEVVEKDGVLYLNAPYEFIDPFTMYTNAS